jgi:hypothetical protein
MGKRSECHPGCFVQRVRKRLKDKEMAFALLQKSERESAVEESIRCGEGAGGRADLGRRDAEGNTADDHREG